MAIVKYEINLLKLFRIFCDFDFDKVKNKTENKKETLKLITSCFGAHKVLITDLSMELSSNFKRLFIQVDRWLARRRQKNSTKNKSRGPVFRVVDFAIALLTQNTARISIENRAKLPFAMRR